MDYYLPDLGGSALLKRLRVAPGIRVLVLSASEDPDDRERVMAAGAQGFLHKSADCRALLDALEQIGQPPRADLRRRRRRASRPRRCRRRWTMALLSALTPRQGEVLRLMCDGLRNREISERLQHDREDREDPRHRHPGDAGRGPDPGHAGRAARRIAGQAR